MTPAPPMVVAVFLNVVAAGSIERDVNLNFHYITTVVTCNAGERLEDLPSFQGYDLLPKFNARTHCFPRCYHDNEGVLEKLYINNCAPPKTTYAELFEHFRTSQSDYVKKKIYISGMPQPYEELKDEMFEGLDIDTLRINISNVEYLYKLDWEDGKPGISLSSLKQLKITCKGDILEEKPKYFFKRTLRLTANGRMYIDSCPSPKKSYSDVIRRLNLSPVTVESLVLLALPRTLLKTSHFQGLAIRKLTLVGERKRSPDYDFSELLNSLSLEEITISYMKLPPFPNETNIHTVSLKHGESAAEFGGCSKLKKLHLQDWNVPSLRSWLGSCTNLREIDLDLLSKSVVKTALNNLTMITSLNITNSNIKQLDSSVLADVVNLQKLNLQNNSLENITRGAFKSQSKLEDLDLSRNSLTDWRFPKYLVSLRKLTLDRNHVSPLCRPKDCNGLNAPHIPPLPIEYISVRHSALEKLCTNAILQELPFENLAEVDLSYNRARWFSFAFMTVKPRKRNLIVNLRGNPLLFNDLKRYEYDDIVETFNKTLNLTIKTDVLTVDCDCKHGWLGKALRELPHVRIARAYCAKDAYGPDQPIWARDPKHQECYKDACNNCTCRMDFHTFQVRADCRKAGLTRMPGDWTFDRRGMLAERVKEDSIYYTDKESLIGLTMNLTEILASGNRIKVIKPEDIPKTLEYLDLQNNDIERLNEAVIAKMFEIPSRRVLLSGNPIICDCDNRPMLAALKHHRHLIEDYSALRCVGTAKLVSELNFDDLCAEERERLILIAAVSGATFLALLVTATALYYRYRQYIKIYLYARGLCLCCVREEEADASRPFDAFVSFAHGDEELVEERLLPHLEHDYQLCVHTRSWVLGEMIHTQILRSVAQSRRTVIVLSRNFVKSVWGMVEFKTAYMSALREGRVRLIVVVVDDVIEDEDLDPELQGYLKTYTYIKFDDPWFLKKLRYALPHRATKLIGRVDKTECETQSGMLRPDVPPMIAVNNEARRLALNSSEEEFEIRTN